MNTKQKYLKKSLIVLGVLLLIVAVLGMASGTSVQSVQAAPKKNPDTNPNTNSHFRIHTYANFSALYHSNCWSNNHRRWDLENRFQSECWHWHVRESAQRGGNGLRE